MTDMDPKLLQLLLDGAELRNPQTGLTTPLDFLILTDAQTLIVNAGWWEGPWGIGDQIGSIPSIPRLADEEGRIWTFDQDNGLILAPPSDEEIGEYLARSRAKVDLHRAAYLRQLLLLSEGHPELNFTPWLQAILDRPEITVAEVAEEETQEREIGKIRLLSGGESVLDTLVIDELGSAATLQPDGFLSAFAEQWMHYAEVDRPSISDFVQWLSTQTPYGGDRYLTDAGVVSASGPVEEIALSLGSR